MRQIPKQWFQHFKHWCVPALIVIGVILVEERRIESNNSFWETKYMSHVGDVTALMDQYACHRIETGEWPDAKNLYGAFFHWRGSPPSVNGRVDVFSDGPAWLRVSLTDDGHIYATILRDAPAEISN